MEKEQILQQLFSQTKEDKDILLEHLDNDKAGMEAVQELQKEYGLRIRDASHIYEGYNDLNDFLRDKRSGQAQRQQEKPEAEKRQSQTEQPKKKGKGIRM